MPSEANISTSGGCGTLKGHIYKTVSPHPSSQGDRASSVSPTANLSVCRRHAEVSKGSHCRRVTMSDAWTMYVPLEQMKDQRKRFQSSSGWTDLCRWMDSGRRAEARSGQIKRSDCFAKFASIHSWMQAAVSYWSSANFSSWEWELLSYLMTRGSWPSATNLHAVLWRIWKRVAQRDHISS